MENPNLMFGNIDEALKKHFKHNYSQQEKGPELLNFGGDGEYPKGSSMEIQGDTVSSGFDFLIRSVALEPDKYRGLEISVTEQLNGNTYFNLKVNR